MHCYMANIYRWSIYHYLHYPTLFSSLCHPLKYPSNIPKTLVSGGIFAPSSPKTCTNTILLVYIFIPQQGGTLHFRTFFFYTPQGYVFHSQATPKNHPPSNPPSHALHINCTKSPHNSKIDFEIDFDAPQKSPSTNT